MGRAAAKFFPNLPDAAEPEKMETVQDGLDFLHPGVGACDQDRHDGDNGQELE